MCSAIWSHTSCSGCASPASPACVLPRCAAGLSPSHRTAMLKRPAPRAALLVMLSKYKLHASRSAPSLCCCARTSLCALGRPGRPACWHAGADPHRGCCGAGQLPGGRHGPDHCRVSSCILQGRAARLSLHDAECLPHALWPGAVHLLALSGSWASYAVPETACDAGTCSKWAPASASCARPSPWPTRATCPAS